MFDYLKYKKKLTTINIFFVIRVIIIMLKIVSFKIEKLNDFDTC